MDAKLKCLHCWCYEYGAQQPPKPYKVSFLSLLCFSSNEILLQGLEGFGGTLRVHGTPAMRSVFPRMDSRPTAILHIHLSDTSYYGSTALVVYHHILPHYTSSKHPLLVMDIEYSFGMPKDQESYRKQITTVLKRLQE